MTPQITSWSYSRFNTYSQCPGKAKLLLIDKFKEPESPALINGQKRHVEMEYFLKGYAPLPEWVHKNSVEYCNALKADKAVAELQVAFDKDWKPVEWFSKAAWARIKIDALVRHPKSARVIDWKGLALDTLIPTPGGFSTMAALQVGDTVFDKDGVPCKVTHKSQIKTLPMYEIEFKDGARVTCDEEHLWLLSSGAVVQTPSIGVGDRIPMNKCVDLPHAELPIHPYVLGYWIGNGRKRDGSICTAIPEIAEYVRLLGYDLGKNIGGNREHDIAVYTVKGIRGALANLGLLDNKHIPTMYLRASKEQRLALLQGLMDSDGHANNSREEAVFSNTNRRVLTGFRELLSSLGIRFRSNTGEANGFGKTIRATQIAFRMPDGLKAFGVGYKAEREATWTKTTQNFRQIRSITPKGVGQSQCIGVDSESSTYLCTNRFVVTHNTGKIRDGEYAEQLELYALTAFLMFPDIEEVSTELCFMELGVLLPVTTFKREEMEMLRARWEQRVGVMLADEVFEYRVNQYCGYCHFRKGNGGPCTAA